MISSTVTATISPADRRISAEASLRKQAHKARWRREHLFFTALPIAMFAVVFVGFSQTYYLKSLFGTPELRWLYHVHGLAFTSWLLLLIIQPALVLAGRTPVHRQIGWIAAGLVPAMTVLAWFVSVDMGRRGAAPPGVPPLVFMIVPMATVVVFPALVAAALYWRHNPDAHKRLMLMATLDLVPAGVARIPGILPLGPLAFFGLSDIFIIVIAAYDLIVRRRLHPATIWGGAAIVATQAARLVVGGTAMWDAFARWAIS